MIIYLRNLWERLRTGYWFVPGLLMLLAMGLAFGTLLIDEATQLDKKDPLQWQWMQGLEWIYATDAEGARKLLSTVAGSMITVAGVVFSITIVVLTLASSQLGPRLLRNFMRDRGSQIVLGTFTATYLYCLLVLRRIQDIENGAVVFVPQLSVTLGILLAIVSLFVLIYYIHHMAGAIQAEVVIHSVSRELHEFIDRLFPNTITTGCEAQRLPHQGPAMPLIDFAHQSSPIPAIGSGYIQTIDQSRLVTIAQQNDIVLCLNFRPGRYVVAGTALALVWPGEQMEERLIKAVNRAFILGLQPTPEQDIEFSIRQLVEVAIRALSTGINDPFTAITCIDYLTQVLGTLASRQFPSPYYYDNEHRLRLITHAVTFSDIVDAAFIQLRQYGCTSVAVAIRLLEGIAMIAPLVQRQADRQALSLHGAMIAEECLRHIQTQRDRDDVHRRHQAVEKALGYP